MPETMGDFQLQCFTCGNWFSSAGVAVSLEEAVFGAYARILIRAHHICTLQSLHPPPHPFLASLAQALVPYQTVCCITTESMANKRQRYEPCLLQNVFKKNLGIEFVRPATAVHGSSMYVCMYVCMYECMY